MFKHLSTPELNIRNCTYIAVAGSVASWHAITAEPNIVAPSILSALTVANNVQVIIITLLQTEYNKYCLQLEQQKAWLIFIPKGMKLLPHTKYTHFISGY